MRYEEKELLFGHVKGLIEGFDKQDDWTHKIESATIKTEKIPNDLSNLENAPRKRLGIIVIEHFDNKTPAEIAQLVSYTMMGSQVEEKGSAWIFSTLIDARDV